MTDELIKRNDKKPEFKLVDIPFLRCLKIKKALFYDWLQNQKNDGSFPYCQAQVQTLSRSSPDDNKLTDYLKSEGLDQELIIAIYHLHHHHKTFWVKRY